MLVDALFTYIYHYFVNWAYTYEILNIGILYHIVSIYH